MQYNPVKTFLLVLAFLLIGGCSKNTAEDSDDRQDDNGPSTEASSEATDGFDTETVSAVDENTDDTGMSTPGDHHQAMLGSKNQGLLGSILSQRAGGVDIATYLPGTAHFDNVGSGRADSI